MSFFISSAWQQVVTVKWRSLPGRRWGRSLFSAFWFLIFDQNKFVEIKYQSCRRCPEKPPLFSLLPMFLAFSSCWNHRLGFQYRLRRLTGVFSLRMAQFWLSLHRDQQEYRAWLSHFLSSGSIAYRCLQLVVSQSSDYFRNNRVPCKYLLMLVLYTIALMSPSKWVRRLHCCPSAWLPVGCNRRTNYCSHLRAVFLFQLVWPISWHRYSDAWIPGYRASPRWSTDQWMWWEQFQFVDIRHKVSSSWIAKIFLGVQHSHHVNLLRWQVKAFWSTGRSVGSELPFGRE